MVKKIILSVPEGLTGDEANALSTVLAEALTSFVKARTPLMDYCRARYGVVETQDIVELDGKVSLAKKLYEAVNAGGCHPQPSDDEETIRMFRQANPAEEWG